MKRAVVGLIIAGALSVGAFALPGRSASADAPNCDANAVVWCGATSVNTLINRYSNGDGHNSAAAIQRIYTNFGISSSDIHGMTSSSQMGSVTSGGNVMLNNKAVATGALTAGRQSDKSFSCGNHGPETAHNVSGTKFFSRAPAASFCESSLQAFVVMKNGVFQFAILTSCGNPVTGTPKTAPAPAPQPSSYTIEKQVASLNTTNFSHSLSVKSGAHVTYRVRVTNTGQADIPGVSVSDNLPNDVVFVSNTLKLNGQAVNAGNFFSSGFNVGTLKVGETDTFVFEAIVGPNDTPANCKAENLDNTGTIMSSGLPNQKSTATVNKQCQPKPQPPVVACASLTSTPVSREAFSFTAKASAQNSTVLSYNFNFGDGSPVQSVPTSNNSDTVQHQYTTPGTYTASVSLHFSGVSAPVTSPACSTTVTVAPPPAAECTNLQLTPNATDQRQVTATVAFQASSGLSLQTIVYDFGDGQALPPTTATTMQHTYAQDGNYLVKATLTFTGSEAVAPSVCQAMVSVMTVQPTCDLLQISSPDANGNVSITNFQTTDNGGTFTGADIDWGDGTTVSSVNPVIGQSHAYALPAMGTSASYTVTAVPHFTVDGQDITANSDGCKQQLTISTPVVPPPPTTPTPTPSTPVSTLVNTGAGSVIGLFFVAAIAGTFAYRRHLRQLLSK